MVIRMDNVSASNCGTGMKVGEGVHLEVTNSDFSNNQRGIDIDPGANVALQNVRAENNKLYGINIDTGQLREKIPAVRDLTEAELVELLEVVRNNAPQKVPAVLEARGWRKKLSWSNVKDFGSLATQIIELYQ